MAMLHREPNRVKWVGVRPGHEGTQIVKANHTGPGLAIIHTVTAGKTFFLTGVSCYSHAGAAIAIGSVAVRNGADVYQYALIGLGAPINNRVGAAISLWPPIEIPAGWDVYVDCGGAGSDNSGTVFGWEE